MKKPLFLIILLTLLTFSAAAQKKSVKKTQKPVPSNTQKTDETADKAIVIDERLAVLRAAPSFFARPLQRMRRGRELTITDTKEADGVTFYRVTVTQKLTGWIQREAVVGKFRRGDDERLSRIVQASEGFDQIERAQIFLNLYTDSPLRPAILLLFGDLLEELALKLSEQAAKRLNQREMAASGAPLHSFYLNYAGLDRYRKIGIVFLFNPSTRLFHYNGAVWREIIAGFPTRNEGLEAQKRLASLKEKMEAQK